MSLISMPSVKKICCPVCFEVYQEHNHTPRVLACGHTICTPCLLVIASNTKENARCPECRIRINSSKAANYPINYTVLQLMNTFSAANNGRREVNQMVAHLNNMKDRIHKKVSEIKVIKQNNQNNILILKSQVDGLNDEQQQLDVKINELLKWAEEIRNKEEKVLRNEGIQEAKETLQIVEEAIFMQFSSTSSLYELIHPKSSDGIGLTKCNVFACLGDAEDRRWAKVIMQGTNRVIHALTTVPPPPGSRTLQFQKIRGPLLAENCVAFLDLWWEKQLQGRILVKMFNNAPRAHQFLVMCSGEMGPSYRGTRFSASHVGEPGEVIFGGTYSFDNKITGKSIVPSMTDDDLGTRLCSSGLVWVLPISSPAYGTIFCVTLRSMPGKLFNGVMGEIVSGLAVLKSAVLHRPIEDITVKDCGIIFTV